LSLAGTVLAALLIDLIFTCAFSCLSPKLRTQSWLTGPIQTAQQPESLIRGYTYLAAHLIVSNLRSELLGPLQAVDPQLAAKWHARGVALAALFSLPIALFVLPVVRVLSTSTSLNFSLTSHFDTLCADHV
jgi:hypothetical protein